MELYTEDQVREFMMLTLIQERLRVLKDSVDSLHNKFKETENALLESHISRGSEEPHTEVANECN